MAIILIAAISDNEVYGVGDSMPWYSRQDLRRFKEVTEGQTVIMGRRTFASLPRNPLPRRHNIVVSSGDSLDLAAGVQVVKTLRGAIAEAKTENVFLIGGMGIWREALNNGLVDQVLLTRIPVCICAESGLRAHSFSELLVGTVDSETRFSCRMPRGMRYVAHERISDEVFGSGGRTIIQNYIIIQHYVRA